VKSKSIIRDGKTDEERKQARLSNPFLTSELIGFMQDVGKRYHGCELENYILGGSGYSKKHTASQASFKSTMAAVKNDLSCIIESGKNVVLFGTCGTGKDHMLTVLAKEAFRQGFVVKYMNGASFRGRIRDGIGSDETEESVIREFRKPDVFWLADPVSVGGKMTQFQLEFLYRIVDARYKDGDKPIWVSVNTEGMGSLTEILGAATVDRLLHGAVTFQCDWPTARLIG
jgi:DNA replication protein DnaC